MVIMSTFRGNLYLLRFLISLISWGVIEAALPQHMIEVFEFMAASKVTNNTDTKQGSYKVITISSDLLICCTDQFSIKVFMAKPRS